MDRQAHRWISTCRTTLAGGVDKDVTFMDADTYLNDQIDNAYRTKYRRYAANII